MKRLALTVALLAAFAAQAQDSTSSGTANSSSTSNPQITSGNSSSSGTVTGTAMANPNNANAQNIVFNSTSGGASSMDATSSNTNRNINEGTTTQNLTGGTNSTVRNIQEGVSTQRVEYSGTQTIKNVPGIQMSGPASGPCTGVSGGLGISGPGWGVGLNGSAVMDDCRLRENTRVLGMAMQSIDGGAYPQERGEVTVLFMDAVRGLAAYNKTIYDRVNKDSK